MMRLLLIATASFPLSLPACTSSNIKRKVANITVNQNKTPLCGKKLVKSLCENKQVDRESFTKAKNYLKREFKILELKFLKKIASITVSNKLKKRLTQYRNRATKRTAKQIKDYQYFFTTNELFDHYSKNLNDPKVIEEYEDLDIFAIYLREKIVKHYEQQGVADCKLGKTFNIKTCLSHERIKKDLAKHFQTNFLISSSVSADRILPNGKNLNNHLLKI